MHTMTPVTPTTTGKIFQISRTDFTSGVTPTGELPVDHPFSAFWLDFRTKICTPDHDCPRLLHAYVSIFLRNDQWSDGLSFVERATRYDQIAKMIHDNPPDLLILEQPAQDGYGLHLREPGKWPYICVTKHWIEEWMKAMAFGPKRRLALALEVLLRATLARQLAHWILTLSVGPHSQEYLDALSAETISTLSPQAIQDAEQKSIPKAMRADWWKHAGSYVEQYTGGGIVGFNISRDDIFIRTDADNFWSPSTPFLFSLRHKGFAHFIPGAQDTPMPHPPITLCIPTAPSSIPACPRTFISDFCGAAEGMSELANTVGDIPKHSRDRILAPSVVMEHYDQAGARLACY